MISRRESPSLKATYRGPQYFDIERWSIAHREQCDGCGANPTFVLKAESGEFLVQCEDCLTETFRKDPEMTRRVLRTVAARL